MDVHGIVLAGVHRWDNSDFDRLLPRPLMPVAHAPLICHVLGWLRDGGAPRACVCANSSSRAVRRALADGAAIGFDLEYYEDWTPRGPAGSIRDAAAPLGAKRLVVVEGTILPECDLRAALRAHVSAGVALTVVAAPDTDGSPGANERLVPAGIYVLERSVLEHIPETGYQDLKEALLPRLHERRIPTATYTLPGPCPRVCDAGTYLALNAWALEDFVRDGRAIPGYERVGCSYVHHLARLSSSVRLIGPVLIGPRTEVGPDATLIGPATIGSDGVIEAAAVVCRSVLWSRCHVGGGAFVDHCVCADGVRVEAESSLHNAVRRPAPASRGRLLERLRLGLFATRSRPPARWNGAGLQPGTVLRIPSAGNTPARTPVSQGGS